MQDEPQDDMLVEPEDEPAEAPEAPKAAPEPTPEDTAAAPRAEKPKKKSRLFDVVIVVVLVAIIAGAAFYYPEVKAFVSLQPWSKAGPRDVVDRFSAAIKANDVAAGDALFDGGHNLVAEGGQITRLAQTAAGPQAPPLAIVEVTPAAPASDAKVTYSYHAVKWGVAFEMPSEAGGKMRLKLRRIEGKWLIVTVEPGRAGDGGMPLAGTSGPPAGKGKARGGMAKGGGKGPG